ncbi:MAG: alpha/beta hydrolase [Gammaproteobacteria bacterium]
MAELDTIELETGPNPAAAVIWMHGLGADAHDFEPVIPILDFGPSRPVRYVFPNAPVRPVTLNGGMAMRAWYDLISMDRNAPEDEAGIRDSAVGIDALIEREVERGIASSQIVMAGFSQGGAMALFTALRYAQPLAGILALSTYLPLAAAVFQERTDANARLPIFMGHGVVDDVVPINFARNSRKRLTQLGHEVEWREYPMPHSVSPDELLHIKAFLDRVLA